MQNSTFQSIITKRNLIYKLKDEVLHTIMKYFETRVGVYILYMRALILYCNLFLFIDYYAFESEKGTTLFSIIIF